MALDGGELAMPAVNGRHGKRSHILLSRPLKVQSARERSRMPMCVPRRIPCKHIRASTAVYLPTRPSSQLFAKRLRGGSPMLLEACDAFSAICARVCVFALRSAFALFLHFTLCAAWTSPFPSSTVLHAIWSDPS